MSLTLFSLQGRRIGAKGSLVGKYPENFPGKVNLFTLFNIFGCMRKNLNRKKGSVMYVQMPAV